MYVEGEILVRDEYLERVLEILGHPPRSELEQAEANPLQPVIAGVTRLTALGDQHALSLSALDAIDERLGWGIATPNHVLTAAGGTASHCPATDPEEVYDDIEPYPSVCDDNGGAGVLVYLADTGLLADAATSHSWLAGVTGDPDPGRAPARQRHADDPVLRRALRRARHVHRRCRPVHGTGRGDHRGQCFLRRRQCRRNRT